MTLSDVSIQRPVFTAMVSSAIVVLGAMGLYRLGVNLFPDVQFPVVTVTTIYPGANPAEIEPVRGEAPEARAENHEEQHDRERVRRVPQVDREALQERDLHEHESEPDQ